jgi:hypothetical protein
MNNVRPQNPTVQPTSAPGVAQAEASPLDDLLTKPMQRYNLALEPQDDAAAWKIAEMCARMHLCGCMTPDDAYLRIIAGRAIGLPAMASVQSIIPIYNKKNDTYTLTMYVKSKLALVLSRPDIIEYARLETITPERAVFVGKRVGQPEQSYEFTIEDAVTAGLVNRGKTDAAKEDNNYNKHPKAMLAWRAGGRLLDLIAGDILAGIASHEDLSDDADAEVRQAAQDRRDGIVPEAVKSATPTRDWNAEAAALKAELEKSYANPDAMKVLRRRVKGFADEAPVDVVAGVESFYNALKKAKGGNGGAPEATKAPAAPQSPQDAPPAAQGPAADKTPPAATQAPPAAGKTEPAPPPAEAQGAYLPPGKRGDAYDGPDQPPIPFGES